MKHRTTTTVSARLSRQFAVAAISTVLSLLTTAAHAAPLISSAEGCSGGSGGETSSCPTAGNIPLTIRGLSFGAADAHVYVGGNDCPVQSQQDDEIICALPSGSGAVVDLVVTDDAGLASLPARLLSYSPPTITSVAGCSDQPDGSTTDCPRSAGTPITIYGENFGPQAKANVGGETCPTTGATDSSIVCTLPPGSGSSKPVLVLAANQLSPASYTLGYAQCPPGTSLDGSVCTPCAAGTFSSSDDASECDTCPAGTVSEAGADSCTGTSDFQCWTTKDLRSPKFTAIDDASVSDELLPDGTADIKKPAMYCTAADLGAAGLTLPGIQQCCYQIKGDKLSAAVPLETNDEIGGTLQVSVQKRKMVCTSCTGSVVP